MKVLVLGAGNVGRAIVYDLSKDFEVWAGDIDRNRLEEVKAYAHPIKIDASDFGSLVETIKGFDLVVGALPGRFGFKTLKAAIEAGVDIVDVSFMPENPLSLREEAEKANITAIVDAGFAPGLSNIFLGKIYQELRPLEEGIIRVGGLPKIPKPPLYYKITWSPYDLIEEYTRKARIVEDGEVKEVDPLEKIWKVRIKDFEFEEFISDGLRTLIETINANRLEERTLRWPGHLEKMKVLKELGFFEKDNVEFTLKVISPLMSYESEDFSIMEVYGRGLKNGKEVETRCFLYDEAKGGFTSMARVTGFTAAIVSRIVLEGECAYGVLPPEILGMREDTYSKIIKELKNRDIQVEVVENAPSNNS
ncbi:saccharopine dehydrogenase NADP-binding domain-containing protein [Thermococcus aggregans]|uniref:Saccharopine dehydrogenase NADP-binding domain-containing protein n=1 Tax=Thermococcus aggregans TaxID=110163 RepID=A0A9E7MXV4_THEAG|nr:saccharopine dehydrogenase C-terminal domain-containing protein [Thermococcus aggregans]USS40936.1 saccharopine dehydrogenase NADP-binding domain-containing protein [Thermococcus aggregans]